jgi:hypothetical protein
MHAWEFQRMAAFRLTEAVATPLLRPQLTRRPAARRTLPEVDGSSKKTCSQERLLMEKNFSSFEEEAF